MYLNSFTNGLHPSFVDLAGLTKIMYFLFNFYSVLSQIQATVDGTVESPQS